MSIVFLLPVVVVFGVIVLGITNRGDGSDYVITRWRISADTTDPSGVFASIGGRRAGLVSFLLTALQISPSFSMVVKSDATYFTVSNLRATVTRVVPHQKVSHITSGYQRPVGAAMAAFVILELVLLVGVGFFMNVAGTSEATGLVVMLLVAQAVPFAVAIAVLLLGRRLSFSILEDSGKAIGFQFKPAVIERETIDEARTIALREHVQRLVFAALSGDAPALDQAPSTAAPSVPSPSPGPAPAAAPVSAGQPVAAASSDQRRHGDGWW